MNVSILKNTKQKTFQNNLACRVNYRPSKLVALPNHRNYVTVTSSLVIVLFDNLSSFDGL